MVNTHSNQSPAALKEGSSYLMIKHDCAKPILQVKQVQQVPSCVLATGTSFRVNNP